MDRTTPQFQTNPPEQAEAGPIICAIRQMQVKEVNPTPNTGALRCGLCRADGATVGQRDYIVWPLSGASHVVNDVIMVAKVGGGTNQKYNGKRISWMEVGGSLISKGQYQGMNFQMVTDNQTGWRFTLSHALI